jgi:hypothetical protein
MNATKTQRHENSQKNCFESVLFCVIWCFRAFVAKKG